MSDLSQQFAPHLGSVTFPSTHPLQNPEAAQLFMSPQSSGVQPLPVATGPQQVSSPVPVSATENASEVTPSYFITPREFVTRGKQFIVYDKHVPKKWEKEDPVTKVKTGGDYFEMPRSYRYSMPDGSEIIMPLVFRLVNNGILNRSTMSAREEFNVLFHIDAANQDMIDLKAALELMAASDKEHLVKMGLKEEGNVNYTVKTKYPKDKNTKLPDKTKTPYVVFKIVRSRYENTVIRIGNSKTQVDVKSVTKSGGVDMKAVWFLKAPRIYIAASVSPILTVSCGNVIDVAGAKEDFFDDKESELQEDQLDAVSAKFAALAAAPSKEGNNQAGMNPAIAAAMAASSAQAGQPGMMPPGMPPGMIQQSGQMMPPGIPPGMIQQSGQSQPQQMGQMAPMMPPGFNQAPQPGQSQQAQYQMPQMSGGVFNQLAQGGSYMQPPQAAPQWPGQYQQPQPGGGYMQPGTNQHFN